MLFIDFEPLPLMTLLLYLRFDALICCLFDGCRRRCRAILPCATRHSAKMCARAILRYARGAVTISTSRVYA